MYISYMTFIRKYVCVEGVCFSRQKKMNAEDLEALEGDMSAVALGLMDDELYFGSVYIRIIERDNKWVVDFVYYE